MRRDRTLSLVLVGALGALAASAPAATWQETARVQEVAATTGLAFSGSGRWYQFGQAPEPGLAWPPYTLSSYSASVDFGTPSARVAITRIQVVEPGRNRPAPVEQRVEQFVTGTTAWNVGVPNNSP